MKVKTTTTLNTNYFPVYFRAHKQPLAEKNLVELYTYNDDTGMLLL